MGKAKRIWTAELDKVDNGFFATTPFFISFAQPASELRKAYYGYLLGLVSLYEGENEQAAEWFRASSARNSDNMFCQYFKNTLTDQGF